MLVSGLLNRIVKFGTLRLVDANGNLHEFTGAPRDPRITIRLHDRALHRRLCLNPLLAVGEAYMDRTLTIEDSDIYDFLAFFGANLGWGKPDYWIPRVLDRFRRLTRRIAQYNPAPRAQRNVAHHYDLSDTLYDLFLDNDRQYSCAYFLSPDDSLETAQEQKKRHIAAKMLLRPGQKVLDIGSGWGGLALAIARAENVDVTGITLSSEQHRAANERVQSEGLADRVRFVLKDYRAAEGAFDRIVSVGMFEHVGVGDYATFFEKVRELLADDGVALLHTIGRSDGPGTTNPWIRKYIFPGGYVPALSEIVSPIEGAGLYLTDIEVLRLHYAETLREWRLRFCANWDVVRRLYDERFCRMWEFYLAASEVAFRHCGQVVFQIQLAKQQDAVPLTRDYVDQYERAVAGKRSAAA